MIVISSALPKSASSLVSAYQLEMLKAAETKNGQDELKRVFGSGFIRGLKPAVLLRLLYINLRHGSVVVKTHAGPNRLLNMFMLAGIVKVTYCFRDPRDVILSAMDQRRRCMTQKGHGGSFGDYTDVYAAVRHLPDILETWFHWKQNGGTLFIRYEDLLGDKRKQILRIAQYLGWHISSAEVEGMITKYDNHINTIGTYNTGKMIRYPEEMSDAEIAHCNQELGDWIKTMGYELM